MKDYQSVVLRIRKALDLYANLRPVKDGGFDIMIYGKIPKGSTPASRSPADWRDDAPGRDPERV